MKRIGQRVTAVLLAVALLLPVGVLPVAAATKEEDLQVITERLKDYYAGLRIIGDGAYVELCTPDKAGEYLAAQRADGSWEDVDYTCTKSAANGVNWEPYLALDRMQAMSIAYQQPDNARYHDAALLAGVEKALAHWATVRGNPDDANFVGPWSVNWWENGIGVQLRFGRIGIFLKEELSAAAKKVLTDKLQKEGDTGTGQNSLWFTQNAMFRALILGDVAQFEKIVTTCLAKKLTMQVTGTAMEAVQVDYSFHGHGELFFSNGYGMAMFRDMSFWMYMLRDTVFQLPRSCFQQMADYMLKGTRWTIRGDSLELSLGYTETSPSFTQLFYEEPLRRMIEMDPDNAADYQVVLDNIQGKRTDNGLSGFNYMWTSAYASQMRADYGINVRMTSKVIKPNEFRATWSDENRGNLVYWAAAGAMTVAADGDEYISVYPTFDWRHTPGVTAPYALTTKAGTDISGDYAAGVSNGQQGAVGFKSSKSDGQARTTVRKSDFFFDDVTVALGAGVASNSTSAIHTTLNQTKAGTVMVGTADGNTTVPLGTDGAAYSGRWVHNNKVGYVFPETTAFHVSNLDQNEMNLPTFWGSGYSQFSQDDWIPQESYTAADTFSLWLDHGVKPTGDSYAYFVLPAATAEETAAYAAENPIEILANTKTVQAVRHNGLKQTQISFFEKGAVALSESTVLYADDACEVIVDETGAVPVISVAVANDTESGATCTISWMDANGQTDTHFAFREAPYTGQTVTLTRGASNVPTPDVSDVINVALNKAVTTSGEYALTPDRTPVCAVDGDNTTRWASARANNQWITVDLGDNYAVEEIRIAWEVACPSKYHVDVSADANAWQTIYSEDKADGGNDVITPEQPVSARYVRVFGETMATVYGMSIFELQVMASPTPREQLTTLIADCPDEAAAAAAQAVLDKPSATGAELTQQCALLRAAIGKNSAEAARTALQTALEKTVASLNERYYPVVWALYQQRRQVAQALTDAPLADSDSYAQAQSALEQAWFVLGAVQKVIAVRPGDADNDGKITTTDARLALQFTADKIKDTALNTAAADVDGTPGVSTTDARLILQHAADKIDQFPCGK